MKKLLILLLIFIANSLYAQQADSTQTTATTIAATPIQDTARRITADMVQVHSSKLLTPFSPRKINAMGKKVYMVPKGEYRKAFISVGYGYNPTMAQSWYSNNVFQSRSQYASGARLDGVIASNIGAINLTGGFEINPWLELGFSLMYSRSAGVFDASQLPNYINGMPASFAYTESFFGFLPNLRVNWMRNDFLCLYSRVGAGIALGNRNEEFQSGMNGKIAFLWQASPIGFEIGNKITFFAEYGFGHLGMISGGLKFKIKQNIGKTHKSYQQKSKPDQETYKFDPANSLNRIVNLR